MAQVRKPEVDARIRAAALRRFAEHGYRATSMAAVAEDAGVATGNVYRYFPGGKSALFAAVVPDALAAEHRRLVADRLARLSLPLRDPGDDEPAAERLLAFWTAQRLPTVILLDRADGTPHEGHGRAFVDQLVTYSLSRLVVEPGREEVARHLLRVVFDNTRRAIVGILEVHADEADVRTAVRGFWSYQLAGLAGFEAWVAGSG